VWSNAGMILTGENRSVRTELCPSTTSSTTIQTWSGRWPNPGLRLKRITVFIYHSISR